MKFNINRQYEKEQTPGDLSVVDVDENVIFKCKSLELAWKNNQSQISCIPEGIYKGVLRTSQKYGRHIHITGVPNRDLILIHSGNFAGSKNPKTGQSDIKGCVMVGISYGDINNDGIKDILASKPTFKKLMTFVKGDITIEICGNGGTYGPQ